MRTRPLCLPLCLLPLLASCATDRPKEESPVGRSRSALGGIEGSIDVALDAPWRIEPAFDRSGKPSYGAIPIQLTVHDGNQAGSDSGRWEYNGSTPIFIPTSPRIGKFCELVIEQQVGSSLVRTHKSLSSLIEVESTTGSWTPNGAPPPHQVCKPANGPCDAFADVGPTSEWHAGAWFHPQGSLEPGQDIPLELRARFTRDPQRSCDGGDDKDFLTFTNHVRVHLGEAPLPRFDSRWLYGDLHYHSQGTDNEGEAGYHYRGVMRAIGAMGVDFAVASEHASSSEQFVDTDVDIDPFDVTIELTGGVLRDMNARRFSMLHQELWKSNGVNAGALDGPSGAPPQGYQSHGVVPRLFLGGEVDVIPEIDKGWNDKSYFFGNGLQFELDKLCGGWFYHWITIDGDCDPSKLRFDAGDAILFKDVQGIHSYDFARAHLVYLPRTSADSTAFVGSFTGKFGGASRRLTEPFQGQSPVLPEIDRKGYAFLAHPVPSASCPDNSYGDKEPNGAYLRTNLEGGEGPDIAPYTPLMLDEAFRSRSVLGLQLWNEDTRLCTQLGKGDSGEYGFTSPNDFDGIKNLQQYGFQTGKFGLDPYYVAKTGEFQDWSDGVEWMLHHGARQWDDMLLKGLDPVETGSIGWLPAGEPRRLFMAGGSDAHGDLNYRREGYLIGTSKVTDTALAKVRNLVFGGAPDELRDKQPIPSHSQAKVFSAMADGNFAVTDGPALRIVVDRNGNGVIDDTDTPMGGIVTLNGEKTLPLLVEWRSTPEFGAIEEVQLYVGVQSGGGIDNRAGATYGVKLQGTWSGGNAHSDVQSSYSSNGLTYDLMKNRYTVDPTGLLAVNVVGSPMGGVRKVDLPIASFEAGKGIAPERLYVRAFARTTQRDAASCVPDSVAERTGACIRRYAFTNPVWAVPGAERCAPKSPRSLDRDGDGIPDGCDPCPDTREPTCKAPRGTVVVRDPVKVAR